jgi:protein SCO1/2
MKDPRERRGHGNGVTTRRDALRVLSGAFSAFAALVSVTASGHGRSDASTRLPTIGPAPPFDLTDQSGRRVTLADLSGKVLAVTFIYTTCRDTCPVLTAKLASLQKPLGADFGQRVRFVSITVEPEVDTPAVLGAYAAVHGADLAGWSFLTGPPDKVQDVVRRYGAFARRNRPGDIDHLFLTTLVDRKGKMRVQYLGFRFDSAEMLGDLEGLLRE